MAGNRARLSALELRRAEDDEPTIPTRVEPTPGLKAFVPIIYGCDNFCAYCVVPFTRGRERSRTVADILAEVEQLAGGGCKEVTLLGQNVNSYGQALHEPADFPTLLRRLNDVPRLERIRFTTSHPKDLSDALIRAMAELPKVCEHLHLPVQSGSDAVLARMNRRYTSAQYLERLARLRDSVRGIAVTTDLLVGFPGETDEDFEATLRLVEVARFYEAFMFAFSPMSGTAAADMPDQLPDPVKHERLLRLIELQNRITAEINQSQLGTVFDILVEGVSRRDPTKVTGLTRTNKTMNFTGDAGLIGKTVPVRAVKPHIWGFMGEALDSEFRIPDSELPTIPT
jgi:tRNA-2-methylthio-N6-dimethylallyladenosine synthase